MSDESHACTVVLVCWCKVAGSVPLLNVHAGRTAGRWVSMRELYVKMNGVGDAVALIENPGMKGAPSVQRLQYICLISYLSIQSCFLFPSLCTHIFSGDQVHALQDST